MITIEKGKEKIVCSKNTFEEQYKPLGYQLASDVKEATKQVASLKEEAEKIVEEKTDEEKASEKYGLTTEKKNVSKKGK